jgi:DNA mismatch repair protein MutL
MPSIKTLSEDVARQIAAGEVVERPASVVKELVENALDAGARAVSVRIEGAGVNLVEIRDDGSGMCREDVQLAPRNFSTSKISGPEDLLKVGTYGFRGEALAAISAVSRLDITASDREGGEGWRITVEGKSVIRNGPAPHEKGTTVRVENLFFNTPARKKFLKSDLTERRRILETILAFALAAPQIEFHYSEDDRPVLDLVPVSSWRQRLAAVLGGSTMKHMVEVSIDDPPLKLRGFASLPAYTRANRNHQFFYVNGRLVREKTVIHAVQDAYRSVIPSKRFPAVVVALDVPFEDVDVNVHPTKLEVRLRNERHVFEVVRRAMKQALSASTEPSLSVSYVVSRAKREVSTLAAAPQKGAAADPEFFFERAGEGRTNDQSDEYKARVRAAVGSFMDGVRTRHDFSPRLSLQAHDSAPSQDPAHDPLKERIQTDDALFWQFNNTYIFIQVRRGLVVIDQHAAHERIIFDTSTKQLESEIPVSQQVLFPITLELSLPELEVFRMTKDLIRKLGFFLEPFGGTSILVRGYPQGLKNWSEGKLLLEIFDDLLNERMPGKSQAERMVASFACRSAVKGGQKLSVDEMRMLADQLFAVDNPYSCPHGRPTIHRISLEDVEHWFSRK